MHFSPLHLVEKFLTYIFLTEKVICSKILNFLRTNTWNARLLGAAFRPGSRFDLLDKFF